MSIDYIISFLYNCFDFSNNTEGFTIQIDKKFIQSKNSSVLKIILPTWGEGETLITKILIWRLHQKGHSCLAYFFPKHLLSNNPNNTVEFFNLIKDQIKSDIEKFKSQFNFKRIDIITASLGVVSACLIANNNDGIKNLFFIVPGSCLASSLWNGTRTQKLKNAYKSQNINQEQLQAMWKMLAPKDNIDSMNYKNIFIAISKSDKVIPYCFGRELADLIKNSYPKNTTVKENKLLGHYLTIVKYYLFDKTLLK